MNDCDDRNVLGKYTIDDQIGEFPREPDSCVPVDFGKHGRISRDERQAGIDVANEVGAQSGNAAVVPTCGLRNIDLGLVP